MDDIVCSFCGKKFIEDNNTALLRSSLNPDCYICEHCLEMSASILRTRNVLIKEKENEFNVPTPKEIKTFLDDYIIEQNPTKKTISVAVYNHYKRLQLNNEDEDIQKSNILLIGDTGTGKTLFAQTISKLLNIPFAISDATALTEAGYVGEDVENILLKLIQNADNDVEKAEKGIIFLDEVDKLANRSAGASITRDVSGTGVQQALLKIIEGSDVNVPMHGGRKHPNQQYIKINTKNILFILGGAFDGLDKIIEQRINGKSSIGFNNTKIDKNISKKVLSEDLIKYGMIPELLGRVPIVSQLHPLNENMMLDILSKPKNCLINQYKKLLELDNIKLRFTNDVLKDIAHLAMEKKLGARGLRTIMEDIMEDIMYNAPNSNRKTITINQKYIKSLN